MPAARIKNYIPALRMKQGGATTTLIAAGSLIGLFPYIYTYATAFSVGSGGNAPVISKNIKAPPTVTSRIFNY